MLLRLFPDGENHGWHLCAPHSHVLLLAFGLSGFNAFDFSIRTCLVFQDCVAIFLRLLGVPPVVLDSLFGNTFGMK